LPARISCLHGVKTVVAREHERQGEQVQFFHLQRPVDGRINGEVGATLLQQCELGRLLACKKLAIE